MIRRLIDLIFALFWIILTSPFMLIVAIVIRLDSPGLVLYTPTMVGRKGKTFRLLRFRTMQVDQTRSDSARKLTRVGRLLRNYSLDHLPTLINLAKGDLTLVGPRPMEMQLVDMRERIWQQYFQVKPGLFNYAVLKLGHTWSSRRITDPALNQELELEYLEKRTPFFDVQLFYRFINAFILSKGNVKARGKPDLGSNP